MKQAFLIAAVALGCAAVASGQIENSISHANTFAIGAKKIRIPPPDGFTRIGPLYNHILSVQVAAEPPENEILALHLPTDELTKYRTNFDRSPDFFTKASVSKIGRDEDVTRTGFEALQKYLESEFARLTDPDGKEMAAGQRYVSKNLSELLDQTNKVKWERPINLGVFERSDRVHSTLTLLSLSANKTPYKFLGTVSFVLVNSRLIYLYAYKSNPIEEDVEMLREFTRRWTASVVAANEEQIAKGR